MINNKFLYYKTKATFDADIEAERISPNSIVFIEEVNYIYTHGHFYDCTPHTGPVQTKKTVMVGHGADYNSAVFTDTNRQLSDDMIVEFETNAGDYIFIKVDATDTVTSLYTYDETLPTPIDLEQAVSDGDYKYYRSVTRNNLASGELIINKQ